MARYDYTYADGWMPSRDNDIVEGTITSIDTGNNAWGTYPILTVEKEDGARVAVHAFHTTLRQALARVRPVVGSPIGIKYLGKKRSQEGGRTYAAYRIISDQSGYDWSQDVIAGPDEEVPF